MPMTRLCLAECHFVCACMQAGYDIVSNAVAATIITVAFVLLCSKKCASQVCVLLDCCCFWFLLKAHAQQCLALSCLEFVRLHF